MKTYRSYSSKDTEQFGEDFAKQILKDSAAKKHATVIALAGDLGAGKTTFAQGFFRGLGIKKRAQSPTFIIMRRHSIKLAKNKFKNIFHIDAYRLKKAEQFAVLEFEAIAGEPQNIVLIEWPEQARKLLPPKTIWLAFKHGKKESERSIMIKR